MTQVLHLSSRWNSFLDSLFIPIQFFFPWMAGCHLIIWDVFHKTISSVFFSLLDSQQLRSTLLLKMPCRALLWQILAFSSPFLSFNYQLLFFRSGGIVLLFSSTHLLVLSRSCSFHDCPFNRSVVPSAQVLFILSSLVSLFNRSVDRSCSSLFLFASGVLSTSFISIVFFSRNVLIFSRFFGFTRLSKKQLSFTSPLSLPFSLRCHSRSRDEILS